MNIEPKCCSCKKYISNDNVLYMCVDSTFCSMSCRDRHLKYIKNFDPEFNYPDRWNNDYTKVDCLIEVDYIHFPRHKSRNKLYSSHSLINLLEYEQKEKMLITCIKLYSFNIKITNNRIKLIWLCLIVIMISKIIRAVTTSY